MLEQSFALFLLFVAVAQAGTLQYKWIDKVGSCKLHYIPAAWQEARLRCEHEGGEIASSMEPSLLTPLMKAFGRERVFLGIHTAFTGEYYSIDKIPLDSISVEWAPNEPNNFDDNENCLALNSNGTVADVKCSQPLPYICCKDTEKAKRDQRLVNDSYNDVIEPMHLNNTQDGVERGDGYTCDKSLGSCYKYHCQEATWPQAANACSEESAQLVILNSQQEAKYVTDLAYRTMELEISGGYSYFVGFRATDVPRIWKTIDGQPLEELDYLTWNYYHLANMTRFDDDGQNCAGMMIHNNDCYFKDYSCIEQVMYFLCEKKMDVMLDKHDDDANDVPW